MTARRKCPGLLWGFTHYHGHYDNCYIYCCLLILITARDPGATEKHGNIMGPNVELRILIK